MRSLLLASAALLGLAVGTAYAQTSPTGAAGPGAAAGSQGVAPSSITPPGPGAAPAEQPTARTGEATQAPPAAPAESVPHPRAASRSGAGQSDVLAPLPSADLRPDGTAMQYLHSARDALDRHQRGEAEEALERAETRMLDRSTTPTSADHPDAAPPIQQIGDARRALSRGDTARAEQLISQVISAGPAGSDISASGMSGGSVSDQPVSAGAMPSGGTGSSQVFATIPAWAAGRTWAAPPSERRPTAR